MERIETEVAEAIRERWAADRADEAAMTTAVQQAVRRASTADRATTEAVCDRLAKVIADQRAVGADRTVITFMVQAAIRAALRKED